MRIENEAKRSFYEIETAKTGWGVRTLQRQYNSSLYERLALSRDKEQQRGMLLQSQRIL
jgi:predicted nuclease of restriction endonuclease-like (RecB) superfamily